MTPTSSFPTRRDEAWKYVSTDLIKNSIQGLVQPSQWEGELPREAVEGADTLVLFQNKVVSSLTSLGEWGELLTFAEAQDCEPSTSMSLDHFSALHQECCEINISGNKHPAKPLQIIVLSNGDNLENRQWVKITAPKCFEGSLILSSMGEGRQYLNNVCWDIRLDRGSILGVVVHHQDDPESIYLGSIQSVLQRDSVLKLQCLSEKSPLVRHQIVSRIEGENAEAFFSGTGALSDGEALHHHLSIFHDVPNCRSGRHFKVSLDGKSRSSFDGTIEVAKGADGTDAQQLNRYLVLNDKARASAKPQLKIYADDVSCAHGSTTGQIDEDELFYLASRGLSQKIGESLLGRGFIEDVLLESPVAAVADRWRREFFHPRFEVSS